MMGKIDKYHWIDLGSSYVPNELSCAVLWAQLEHVNDISARRRANFAVYMDGLQDIAAKGIMRIPVIPSDCQSNAHIFFMLFPTRDIRDHYSKELKRRGIAAFSHYVALHSAPAGTLHRCFFVLYKMYDVYCITYFTIGCLFCSVILVAHRYQVRPLGG